VSDNPTIADQAAFISDLYYRCVMRGGVEANEAVLVLSAGEISGLRRVMTRLERIAPHEDVIRKIANRK